MRFFLLLLAGLGLASPVLADSGPNQRAEASLAKVLAGRVAGEPVDCIQLHDIDSTEVFDNTAILYRTIGGKLYLNRPRSGLASLNDDDILVTKSWTPELCSIDTVNLVDRTSHFPTGFVFLGKFVPYSKAQPSR
ncbi:MULTISPECIES: hypothetical protein [unclassified Sphingomonas]|uniref:hypothetical protein n=1 Tax=unclassified Sphingomonas TaxID=196159 RepID=UPI0006F466AC|nr:MULTISPECIES: hypothetical protein [unclassified Sphingomonas]KQX24266.1 hypothetical protein ASD17_25375 [Sphingomonas sp. Root1294]KQY69561.1 hypothetical protein ASD39_24660 [Sphingomonas sp. Root50]KRB87489.1 hypothetical protein ASE22_24210 [Sphingomonas sp. Root720]